MAPRSCLLLLLLLLFLVPAHVTQCSTDRCVTDCTGCALGEMVADPQNCRRYYMCDDEGHLLTDLTFDCPDGEVFDAALHACVEGDTCTPCPSGKACHYLCQETNNNLISSPYNCGVYQTCDAMGNTGPRETCPSEAPYFDGDECQADPTRCCHCRPYCFSEHVARVVPDPRDCRKYYICVGNLGEPTVKASCVPGEIFDSYLLMCSPDAPCVTLCENVVRPDGCIEPFLCHTWGDFPKCPGACVPQHYRCRTLGHTYVEASSCPAGSVFHPDLLYCVTEDECPY